MPVILHNEQLLLDIQKDIDNVVKDVGEEALKRVEERTPVRTGYARSRWRLETYSSDPSFTLENDAEYVSYLENGSSSQAPLGMLAITMVEVPDIVDAAVARYQRD